MTQDDDPVFIHPENYGIENIEEPGEPNRAKMPPSEPVPGTGRKAKEKHRREHNKHEGHVPQR